MTTPVTEHTYPPMDSQGIHTFIADQGGTLTGDLQTDFRNALFIAVAPGGKANDYSIDDLWQRHIIANVAGDANAEAGNPAAAGRGKSGFVGNSLHQYYGPPFLKNPGNANTFPGGSAGLTLTLDPLLGPGAGPAVLSNGNLTMACTGASWSWRLGNPESRRNRADGGKWLTEATVDAENGSSFMVLGIFDTVGPSQAYAGQNNGCGCLFTPGTGIGRTYRGAADNAFDTMSPKLNADAGDVITMACNLDDNQVTYYVNGNTTGTFSMITASPGLSVMPVFKAYYDTTLTLSTTVLFPVDGYEPWY